MENNVYIYHTSYNIYESTWTTELSKERFYIYAQDLQVWVEIVPENRKFQRGEMPEMMKDIIFGAVDFFIPLEDGTVLITGKNLAGEDKSRVVAAGLFIVNISAGKVVKVIKGAGKVIGKGAKYLGDEAVKVITKKAGKETAEKTIELVGKYDWGLVKRYFKHIQEVTGRDVHPKQIDKLKEALRKKEYTKLSPQDYANHKKNYTSAKREELIKKWEKETGEKWPVDENGRKYQLHHIIEQQFGGNHEWWNIHPAKFPDEHQKLIHGKNSPSRKLFK